MIYDVEERPEAGLLGFDCATVAPSERRPRVKTIVVVAYVQWHCACAYALHSAGQQ